jgi:basic amino acid/polyamine antiporter, APA family
MGQTDGTGLVRGIRRWDLVALVINGVIGAGIFGLPSKVYALIGSYSLAAFLVCALVVALIVLCFAEVSSRFSATGGPYLYAHEAFGPAAGFGVGWLMWLTRVTAFAANCNLLVGYAAYFWPAAGAGPWRAALICAVVASLTAVNVAGVREMAVATNLFTVGKLVPILLFVAAGIFFIDLSNFTPPAHVNYGDFSTSVLLLIYAFTGFEVTTVAAGEARDPRRDLPFALLLAIGVVALIYVLVQAVCVGTLPGLADSERPLADAAGRFFGATGVTVIAAGALISITGSLNVSLLGGSRLPFAMAERRQLPGVLAAAHPRYRTPHVSILLTAAVILALTLSGSFIYALTLSTITRLVIYASTCAALPVLRRKRGAPAAGFTAPAGLAVSAAALGLAAWLLSNSTWREARDVGLAAAFGLFVYMAYRLIGHKTRAVDVTDPGRGPEQAAGGGGTTGLES